MPRSPHSSVPGGLALGLALCACSAPNPRVPDEAPRQPPPAGAPAVLATDATGQGPTATPNPTALLDLADILRIALRESPDLGLAQARIELARADLETARADDLPSLDLGLEVLRADAPSTYLFKSIDSGRFQPGTDFNAPGVFENWEASLGLRWNLYDGGRTGLAKAIARGGVELEREAQRVAENALVGALIDAYYSARAAAASAATAALALPTLERQLELARARFEEGQTLESDVLSLEVRRAEAREAELQARQRHDLARAALGQLMGVGGLVELAPEAPAAVTGELPGGLPEALERALASRPELEQARTAVDLAERRIELARAAILPRLDLFGRGWRDAPHGDFDESRDNWALGLSLGWSPYDGGRRGAGAQRARAELAGARRIERKAELAVEFEVRGAWLRLEQAKARIEVNERAAHQAQDSLARVEAQYEAGGVPVTRYLEAELTSRNALTRRTIAIYDARRAAADLARAMGASPASAAAREHR